MSRKPEPKAKTRAERLAEALRRNISRRKAATKPAKKN
jgi:hypothetical protein